MSLTLPVAYVAAPHGYKLVDRAGRAVAIVARCPGADPEAFAKQICVSLNAAHPYFVESKDSIGDLPDDPWGGQQ